MLSFTEESNKVDRFEDGDAIVAILEGLQIGDFLSFHVKESPHTMANLSTQV